MIPICHCEIRPIIPIEVADHDGPRPSTYLEISARLKRPIDPAPADHRQIRNSVSVEVRHGDGTWHDSRLKMPGRPKGSIAVAQDDGHSAAGPFGFTGAIGYHQVLNIVAVEITNSDGTGTFSDPELAGGFKPSSATS